MKINLKNLTAEQTAELLPENLILLGFRGSVAHNMYIPQNDPSGIDDKDVMGVYIGPREHYLGFGRSDVKERFIGEWDAVSYEIRKYIGLLLKLNPNVLSLLWLPDRQLIYQHELGRILRERKQIFVSKAAYHSFNGYAYAQFKRMTHFNQEKQVEMAALEKIISDQGIDLNELNATQEQRQRTFTLTHKTPEVILPLDEIIKQYQGMKARYYSGGYMGQKRKALVRQFGYDCKNAAHLIRLLRMGIEFLVEGELHVERADSENLLEIKRGEWSLDKVKEESERLFKLAEEAYVRSTLPARPDHKQAEALCVELVEAFHGLTATSAEGNR